MSSGCRCPVDSASAVANFDASAVANFEATISDSIAAGREATAFVEGIRQGIESYRSINSTLRTHEIVAWVLFAVTLFLMLICWYFESKGSGKGENNGDAIDVEDQKKGKEGRAGSVEGVMRKLDRAELPKAVVQENERVWSKEAGRAMTSV